MNIRCMNHHCLMNNNDIPFGCNYYDESEIKNCQKFMMVHPTVVCLCGSTKFKQTFIDANFRETMIGKIVLSVGWFSHVDGEIYTPTTEEMIFLNKLHFRKIDLADEVLVLNVGGYIGESTRNELNYAITSGKHVRFLEGP